MLKKVIGTKGIILSVGLMTVVVLSGCGNDPVQQDSTGAVIYEEEPSENQEAEHPEEAETDNTQSDTQQDTQADTQPQKETSITLTDAGKVFLMQACSELNDFHSGQAMDEKFWGDFLFQSYTGASSENAVTEQVYREDLGFEETVVKVSLQEAQERAKLVLGVELPELEPSFEEMEKGQTSFYYKDGCYYIGVSGLPDYQYTFSGCTADQENNTDTIVKYTIDFMGESNIGTVTFSISPKDNENGFVIRSKTTEFVK